MSVLDLIPQKKKKAAKRAVIPKIEVPRYQPPLKPSQNPVPTRILKKLKALGSKYRNVHLVEKIAQVLAMAVILVTLQMFLDWLINLNLFFRVLILGGDLCLLALFFRKQILPLIKRPPNVEVCALMVEKKWPRHRGKVIATVQFANPSFTNNSQELIRSIQMETDAATGALDFSSIVSTKLLKRRVLIAFCVMAIFGGMMYITAPGSISLLERVFLIPVKVPRKTDITVLSGNKVIPAGESVLLEAQASGIVPSHGRVTMTDEAGKIQEITIDPETDNPDRFSLKIDRVSQSFSYVIRLNDAVSDTYQIKAIPRPNVTSIACEQVYPAYTGLPNVKRTVGNLALLAGSKLNIHAETNSKIEKATLTLIGLNKTIPLTIDGLDGNQLLASIDIPSASLTGFSIQLTDQAGIVSGDETQYSIDIIPDHPPTVQLTYPEKLQELFTLKAKPTIAFVAGDDYGLAKVTLCYRILLSSDATTDTSTTTTPPKPIEMDLGTDHPKDMKNRYLWDLATIQPPVVEGNTVEYWMEAQDANNVTGPGISDSEHHTIKIVSEVEKKAEVMNRLMDSLSSITDISQNQEKINQDLGTIIQGKDQGKDDKK